MSKKLKGSGVEKLLSEDHDDLDLLLSAVFDALDVRDPKEVLSRLDLFWARLAMHIRSENLRLFPAISHGLEDSVSADGVAASEKLDVDKALAQLRKDHDYFMRQLASGVNTMHEATSQSSTSANIRMTELTEMLTAVRKRLEAHDKLEEETIYRLPAKLLDQVTQSMLETSVNKDLENLPPRFTNLSDPREN